ncbi:unannotated protein [freshwater metagenome]|uniref:Unannotated protein n=1 Tax=freshwater metagenome TaxID=449393 RepID=A0A6J7I1Y6_9ZZZZ|nr:cytochrome P450 [Actinomycetota bacterium]
MTTAELIAAAPRPPADFNPVDQQFIANPYPMLDRLRQECPVFYSPDFGFWGIVRYEAIEQCLSDFETFCNGAVRFPPVPDSLASRVPEKFFSKAFIAMDPPEHTKYRKAGNQGFTRGRMKLQEEPVREIMKEILDEVEAKGHCDFMQDIAYTLTVRTIMALLEVPAERTEQMRALAEDFPSIVQDGIDPMPEQERNERWGRMVEAREYFAGVIEERRANPGPDLLSEYASMRDENGEYLFDTQRLVTHCTEMIFGGTDTTANTMAFALRVLQEYPELRQQILDDPSLIENLIEEVLRYQSVTVGIFKTTTRDVEVDGVTIPEGSLCWLTLAAAGRDGERFENPDTFDVRRENAKDHLTFGKGRHKCIGAPLARVEARVGLEELFKRLPNIHITEGQDLKFQEIMLTNVLKHLDVAW